MAHAKYSASGSHRWLNCPGSIKLEAEAPPQAESVYAAEGTFAHECFEMFVNGLDDIEGVKADALSFYDAEMVEHCEAMAYALANIVGFSAEVQAETRVDLSFVAPGMFGTADVIARDEFEGVLTIGDLKYGAGIPVDVYPNSQLMYYALGASALYKHQFKRIRLAILQPRAEHADGPVRVKEITLTELLTFEDVLKIGVMNAEAADPKVDLKSGDWCRFCRAAPICPKLSAMAFADAAADFDGVLDDSVDMVPPHPAKGPTLDSVKQVIAPENLGRALEACDRIELWVKRIREYAFERLQTGHAVDGYKLVPRRAIRKWANELDAETAIRAKYPDAPIIDAKLKSPAQIEKLTKDKSLVDELASAESSGVTLAPASDKRPAVDPFADFNTMEVST